MDKLMRLLGVMVMAAGLVLAGCSDDDNGDADKGTLKMDSAVVDQTPADTGGTPDKPAGKDGTTTDGIEKTGNMGEGCTKVADCTGKPATCLTISKTKKTSVCSATCTPDDSKTPLVNEDSCPKNFTCARILMSDQTYKNFCLKECVPSETKNPCPKSSNTSCRPYSSRMVLPGNAVCFYAHCTVDKDCPVRGDKDCTGDGDCASVGTGAFCYSKKCALPGKCLTAAGICGKHTVGKAAAKVGDPCKSDLDCNGLGYCMLETSTYTGAIGVAYRNGYCAQKDCMFSKSMPSFACPTGSHCNQRYYGGFCFKACKQSDAKGCRGYAKDKGGDYECYDWSGWTTAGVKIAAGPTCQTAAPRTCDTINSTAGCKSLCTDSKNPTKMECRDRYTGVILTDKASKKGVCLDTTTSGTYDKPKADAGTPPAKDAGTGG